MDFSWLSNLTSQAPQLQQLAQTVAPDLSQPTAPTPVPQMGAQMTNAQPIPQIPLASAGPQNATPPTSMFSQLLDKAQNDEGFKKAMLVAGLQMLQGRQYNQTVGSQLANGIGAGMNYYDSAKSGEEEARMKQALQQSQIDSTNAQTTGQNINNSSLEDKNAAEIARTNASANETAAQTAKIQLETDIASKTSQDVVDLAKFKRDAAATEQEKNQIDLAAAKRVAEITSSIPDDTIRKATMAKYQSAIMEPQKTAAQIASQYAGANDSNASAAEKKAKTQQQLNENDAFSALTPEEKTQKLLNPSGGGGSGNQQMLDTLTNDWEQLNPKPTDATKLDAWQMKRSTFRLQQANSTKTNRAAILQNYLANYSGANPDTDPAFQQAKKELDGIVTNGGAITSPASTGRFIQQNGKNVWNP